MADAIDEIQKQIDDIYTQIDEINTSIEGLSANFDEEISSLEQTLDEQQITIDELKENSGQLLFPINQDTIDLIKEQFPCGFTSAMSTGVVTIIDARISPTSNILYSVFTPGGTQGFLSCAASTGQAIITSTSATETSILSYLILN